MKLAAAVATTVSLGLCGFSLQVRARESGGAPQSVGPANPARVPGSVWDGVYTLGQARRGAALSERCVTCHGADLEGDIAPTLVGPAFAQRWNGWSLGDVFGMVVPNFRVESKDVPAAEREELIHQQSADFLAYILFGNRFPAGQTELPNNVQVLKQIRFQKNKPQ